MAPGTRTPNERKLTNECAGLPRDLNTERAAKTLAEPGGCLLARPNTGTDTKHQTQEHWSQAFNASRNRLPKAAERSGAALGSPSLRDC